MLIGLFPADKVFIDFYDAEKFFEILVMRSCPKTMADIPSSVRGRPFTKIHPANLSRRHALFALQHRVEHFEPRQQRNVGILENRSDEYREPIRGLMLVGFIAALPGEGARRALVHFRVAAKRTLWASGPSAHRQKETASCFIGERRHELLEGLHDENNSAALDCSQVPSRSRPVGTKRRRRLAPVEAKFLLAFDLDDAGILNDDFYRAESDRTQRAHDLTNSTSLVVVENFAPGLAIDGARFHIGYLSYQLNRLS